MHFAKVSYKLLQTKVFRFCFTFWILFKFLLILPKKDSLRPVSMDMWITNSIFPCIQWTPAAMLVQTVKNCEYLAYGWCFWAARPRHTLSGLHHNYVTRTRAGKTLPYQPLLRRHTHTHTGGNLSHPSTYSRMANSSTVRFSHIASDVVELAEKLALASNSIFIGTEHLLQALLTLPNRYPLWHMYLGKG